MKIIKNTESNIKLNEVRVFLCVPGIGKTYLANSNNKFIDIDRLRSNYKYDFNGSIQEHEELKHTNRKTVNYDYKEYTNILIDKYLKQGKIILAAPNEEICSYLQLNNIPYALVYINLEDNNLMINRLKNRGNNIGFINKNYSQNIAKYYYEYNLEDKRPCYKIELNMKYYLSDLFEYIKNNRC